MERELKKKSENLEDGVGLQSSTHNENYKKENVFQKYITISEYISEIPRGLFPKCQNIRLNTELLEKLKKYEAVSDDIIKTPSDFRATLVNEGEVSNTLMADIIVRRSASSRATGTLSQLSEVDNSEDLHRSINDNHELSLILNFRKKLHSFQNDFTKSSEALKFRDSGVCPPNINDNDAQLEMLRESSSNKISNAESLNIETKSKVERNLLLKLDSSGSERTIAGAEFETYNPFSFQFMETNQYKNKDVETYNSVLKSSAKELSSPSHFWSGEESDGELSPDISFQGNQGSVSLVGVHQQMQILYDSNKRKTFAMLPVPTGIGSEIKDGARVKVTLLQPVSSLPGNEYVVFLSQCFKMKEVNDVKFEMNIK